MVLCTECKYYLTNAGNRLLFCWATDYEMTMEKVLEDVPCQFYEPVDCDES